MNERKPLSAQYIGTMHKAAMRALADIAVRRRWGNSRHASPVATLSLCEEIARLQIERAEMLAALKAIDKFALVIESAVRHDAWRDLAEITAALKAGAAVITKAEGAEAAQQPAKQPPYPFCHTPERCADKGRCQSEIACND